MQQIFLLLLVLKGTAAFRQPACPNDHPPKMDKEGRPIQCLPGSSSRLVCGDDHACFFSGMNYMCCPTNEPSNRNQFVCPAPLLTVLDSKGLPQKCNTWTRECPQASMICSLVGRERICCERLPIAESNGSAIVSSSQSPRTKLPKKKARKPAYQGLECPANSIGLLNPNGSPVFCNGKNRCSANAFCHSTGRRPICCEPYNFASNILESTKSSAPPTVVHSSAKVNDLQTLATTGDAIGTADSIASTTAEMVNSPRNTILLKQSLKKKTAEKPRRHPTFPMSSSGEAGVQRSSSAPAAPVAVVETTTFSTATTTATIAIVPTTEQTVIRRRPVSRPVEPIQQLDKAEPHSLNLPSQMLSGQDKRVVAEQFLMHQIRNGWPYDDRFYRPDVDTFSPQQRQRMAQIYFADN
ncbi:hypothetical protein Y032_0142g2306 [Ancylostoma ceylanicum]|uniref:WAP domain-containing protein n=1 Tax=Ancylostoma ceylanicum TaxID=53326 RepID=A0A016T2L3_9BILA|nr:hypothetical protein Y032_0142g2306 [Ancylostoma ceylanicum]